MLLLNVLLIGLPSGLVLLLCIRQLARSNERFGLIFVLGMAALVLALIIGLPLNWLTERFLRPGSGGELLWRSFVQSAALEECSKLALFLLWWRRLGRGHEARGHDTRSGLAATITIALGFALLENSWYLIANPTILILRGIAVAGLHASASALATVGVVANKRMALRATGLLAAIGLHGLYNLVLLRQQFWLAGLILLIGLIVAAVAWFFPIARR